MDVSERTSLVTGWFEGDERQIHRVHDIGSSGIVTGLLIAVPPADPVVAP
jgi:hypothetical protein